MFDAQLPKSLPKRKNAEPLDHPKEEIQIWPGTNHWCTRGIFIIDIHLSKHQETEETEQWIARCQLRTRTTKTSNTWKPGMIWHWTQLEPTRDQIILILTTYTWNSYFQEWRIPITFPFCFKSQRQNTRNKKTPCMGQREHNVSDMENGHWIDRDLQSFNIGFLHTV